MTLFEQPITMRALTWKQPYADLMLHGKIETRTWATSYRGMVLICAGLSTYQDWQLQNIAGSQYSRIVETVGSGPYRGGVAIAVGSLTDCHAMRQQDADKCFVHYVGGSGLYCHVYDNVRPIKPFPWKGSQGWRAVPPEIIETIEYL